MHITTFISDGKGYLKYELKDKQGNRIYLRIVQRTDKLQIAISKNTSHCVY